MAMRYVLTYVLFLVSVCSYAQNLHINPGVDTLDADVRKSLAFYRDYLNQFRGLSTPGNFGTYWSQKDCETFVVPDPLIYALNGSYPTYSLASSKTLFYVKPEEKFVRFKVLYGWVDSTSISLFCIANHYIRFNDKGNPEFVNAIALNTKDWERTAIRNITFVYPQYHKFDRLRADSLIASVEDLEKEWSLKPVNITYFLAKTREEIDRIRGLDFSLLAGNREKPSGISDDRNNIVYCSGLGENYFHEVVHVYLNHLYKQSPLVEGIAVFYGGSMGKSLKWHLARLKTYLQANPGIDLNKLDEFWYMDNFTNPNSTIKGMLCRMAFEKDKVKGLRRIMSYKSMEEIFSNEFNVKKGEWNDFLRRSIDEMYK
jgi:hypothetical protein